jgi:hypothetical protein
VSIELCFKSFNPTRNSIRAPPHCSVLGHPSKSAGKSAFTLDPALVCCTWYQIAQTRDALHNLLVHKTKDINLIGVPGASSSWENNTIANVSSG